MDVWLLKQPDHYEYIAVYVDDLMIVSKRPMQIVQDPRQKGNFDLKGVGKPKYYLGGTSRGALGRE